MRDNTYDKQGITDYINNLEGYRGYVLFSHRKLDKKDIFIDKDPIVSNESDGFITEAHFSDDKNSITIHRLNDTWYADKQSLEDNDTQTVEEQNYLSNIGAEVKMVQIWQQENDPLCLNKPVWKLKKVVFAGFEPNKGGES